MVMDASTFEIGEEALLWIAQACRMGFAYPRDNRIELRGEYLETLSYCRAGDVLTIDLNREAQWLSCLPVSSGTDQIIFHLGSEISFVIPVDPSIIKGARYLVLTQKEVPVSPPMTIKRSENAAPLPVKHAFFRPEP